MTDDELGTHLISCALRVHSELGPGLLESVYEVCLVHELKKAGIHPLAIRHPLPSSFPFPPCPPCPPWFNNFPNAEPLSRLRMQSPSYIIAAMETGVSAFMLAPLLAGIVSIVTMVVLMRSRSLPLDKPNERSLHVLPVPRTGGIAIIAGVIAAALWLQASPSLWVPAVALAIASYFDDRHALPAAVRLSMDLVVAGIFLWLAAGSSTAAFLLVLC